MWRQSTLRMAAQFIVAMITALMHNCRIAWCIVSRALMSDACHAEQEYLQDGSCRGKG